MKWMRDKNGRNWKWGKCYEIYFSIKLICVQQDSEFMTAFKARIWILGRKIIRFHPFLILQSFLSLSLSIFSENEREGERERGFSQKMKEREREREEDAVSQKMVIIIVKEWEKNVR